MIVLTQTYFRSFSSVVYFNQQRGAVQSMCQSEFAFFAGFSPFLNQNGAKKEKLWKTIEKGAPIKCWVKQPKKMAENMLN